MKYQNSNLLSKNYRPDIDGLRALAVLAVIAFHAFPNWVKGGFIGVDIFFVISGYVISINILDNLNNNNFRIFDFYSRRIKRIFPALLIVLIACYAFGWFELLAEEYRQLGKHIVGGASFVSNFILWNEAGYFDNSAETKPLLHLWSLGIEEQFYILWPVLLWFCHRKRFNIFIIAAFIALASFIINIQGVRQDPISAFYSPLSRFWELSSGSLLAWASIYNKQVISKKLHGHQLSNILSCLGVFLLICGFFSITKDLSFPGNWALIPVSGTVFIILAGAKAWANRTIFSSKVAVFLGSISFPLYLWHWPLLSFAAIVGGGYPGWNIRIASIIISFILAWLTFKIVEKPVRFGKKYNKIKIASLVTLMAAIGYAGLNTYQRDGLSFREKILTNEKILIRRNGLDLPLAYINFIKGKDDWLFLGNAYDRSVLKLKLVPPPEEADIAPVKKIFSALAKVGAASNTKVALIIGPNKSSVYPEYLPDDIVPSKKKYIDFFLDELNNIENLVVYNPTDDLIKAKTSEGILYYRTDTHWNNKGAFLAYSGFSKAIGLPVPGVDLVSSPAPFRGDLIDIAHLKEFPLHNGDSWDVVPKNNPELSIQKIPNEPKTAFGYSETVINKFPLSDKYIWIVGDSFTGALKQYFNSTFREVRYVGHWIYKLEGLADTLAKESRKPDMVIVVRVERSF